MKTNRTKPTIQDIFQEFGPEYLERYGERMPKEHRKVYDAIVSCRSGEHGVAVYRCEKCGKQHTVNRSCGNRHCPTCQFHKQEEWLEKQLGRALPTHYFLATMTVPEELRGFMRSHQKATYGAFFDASASGLKKLMKDPRFVGTDLPGFFGVLQTWGRTLSYHPHLHFIIAGGGLSEDRRQWIPSKKQFLVPAAALSRLIKGKFKAAMKDAGLFHQISGKVWKQDWVVDIEALPGCEEAIGYLAPYIFKVAISDHRIVRTDGEKVFFTYRKHDTHTRKLMSLDGIEFIRRYLQHVLPSGFMKVRHYGFLSGSSKVDLDELRWVVWESTGRWPKEPESKPKSKARASAPYCPDCGGPLLFLWSEIPTAKGWKRIYPPLKPPLLTG